VIHVLRGGYFTSDYLAVQLASIRLDLLQTAAVLKYPKFNTEGFLNFAPKIETNPFDQQTIDTALSFIKNPNLFDAEPLSVTGVSLEYLKEKLLYNYFYRPAEPAVVDQLSANIEKIKSNMVHFASQKFNYNSKKLETSMQNLFFQLALTKTDFLNQIILGLSEIKNEIDQYKSKISLNDAAHPLQILYLARAAQSFQDSLTLLLTSIEEKNLVSDHTETLTGKINLSPYSYYNKHFGIFVTAHEIAHNLVKEMADKNNPGFARVSQCLFKNHPVDDHHYERDENGNLTPKSRLSEDFADWFAVRSRSYRENPWCGFLGTQALPTDFKNDPLDPHSSTAYRLVWAQKASGGKLPPSCRAYLDSVKNRYPMNVCDSF
jgi:hypothetical protein